MADEPTTERQSNRRSVRDRGVTFIEILVSIVLLGTAGVAVLTGIAATLRSVNTHDRLATAQARVADAGDFLTDVAFAGDNYVPCAGTGTYQSEIDPSVSITQVLHWDASILPYGDWSPSCTAAEEPMQRITLSATVEGLTRELVVIKRQGTEASAPGGAWNDGMITPGPTPPLTLTP